MSKLPWFPMYAGDWFLSTSEMSNAEKGAYIDLLCMQWDNGSILKVPTRYLKEWETLKEKFEQNGEGRFINKRLHKIRIAKDSALEKQRLGGIQSGKVRGKQPTKVPTKQPAATRARNQSQISESEEEIEPKKRYDQTAFDQFWAAYPRKVGKQKAVQWWKRYEPDAELLAKMLATIKAFMLTEQWQDPKLRPHPITWLNRGGWDDEAPAEVDQKAAEREILESRQQQVAEDAEVEANLKDPEWLKAREDALGSVRKLAGGMKVE